MFVKPTATVTAKLIVIIKLTKGFYLLLFHFVQFLYKVLSDFCAIFLFDTFVNFESLFVRFYATFCSIFYSFLLSFTATVTVKLIVVMKLTNDLYLLLFHFCSIFVPSSIRFLCHFYLILMSISSHFLFSFIRFFYSIFFSAFVSLFVRNLVQFLSFFV